MWTGLPCHALATVLTVPVCNVTPAPVVRTGLIVGLSFAINIIRSVEFDESAPYQSWSAVTGTLDDLVERAAWMTAKCNKQKTS